MDLNAGDFGASNSADVPYLLLVEDSRLQRERCCAQLQTNGFPVVAVADGGAALSHLKSHRRPVAIVLDCELPDLGGLQLLVLIRAIEFRVRPYVLMFTQRSDTDLIAAALDRGADDFVTKSVDALELRARVRVAIRTFHLQSELVERLAEVQALSRRDSLQSKLLAAPLTALPEQTYPDLALSRVAALEVLGHLGLAEAGPGAFEPVPSGATFGADYEAWAGFLGGTPDFWVDMRLRATQGDLLLAARALVGDARFAGVAPDELLAELLHLIRGQWLKRLGQPRESILAPAAKCFRAGGTLPGRGAAAETVVLETTVGRFELTVERESAAIAMHTLDQIGAGLLLAEDLRAPLGGRVLVKRGSVVHAPLVRRLRDLDGRVDNGMKLSALRPSACARAALLAPGLSAAGPLLR